MKAQRDIDQVYVAIHRVVSHLKTEDLHELANLETSAERASYHYGANAQLAAQDAISKKIGEIIEELDNFSLEEMAHYIRTGYKRD
jgi:hypothetical protein